MAVRTEILLRFCWGVFAHFFSPFQIFHTFFPNISMLKVRDFPGLLKFTICDRTPRYLDTKFTNPDNLQNNLPSQNDGPYYRSCLCARYIYTYMYACPIV